MPFGMTATDTPSVRPTAAAWSASLGEVATNAVVRRRRARSTSTPARTVVTPLAVYTAGRARGLEARRASSPPIELWPWTMSGRRRAHQPAEVMQGRARWPGTTGVRCMLEEVHLGLGRLEAGEGGAVGEAADPARRDDDVVVAAGGVGGDVAEVAGRAALEGLEHVQDDRPIGAHGVAARVDRGPVAARRRTWPAAAGRPASPRREP